MNPEDLQLLVTRTMPFGKYKGRILADLPGDYLRWFVREGVPKGEMGRLLTLMHEIDQTADLIFGHAFAHKPTQVVARQISNAAAFVFSEGHFTRQEKLQVFRIHGVACGGLAFLTRARVKPIVKA